MNRNLYITELKRSLKNLITWSLIIIGFTLMVLSIYPYMSEMGDDITQLMSNLPEELKKAMGMDDNTWSSIIGFYNTYYGIYIIVLIGIYTSSTGATIISKEEKDRTAEFLITRPMSRLTIFKSKMGSLFTLVCSIYIIQTITAVLAMTFFSENTVNWGVLTTMHMHGYVLILFFTCVGVILSMFVTPKKNFMGMVVGIVFGSYFLDAISKAAAPISWIGYLSPFHYVGFDISNPDYSINFVSIISILILCVLLLIISFKAFNKKDINA